MLTKGGGLKIRTLKNPLIFFYLKSNILSINQIYQIKRIIYLIFYSIKNNSIYQSIQIYIFLIKFFRECIV